MCAQSQVPITQNKGNHFERLGVEPNTIPCPIDN